MKLYPLSYRGKVVAFAESTVDSMSECATLLEISYTTFFTNINGHPPSDLKESSDFAGSNWEEFKNFVNHIDEFNKISTFRIIDIENLVAINVSNP